MAHQIYQVRSTTNKSSHIYNKAKNSVKCVFSYRRRFQNLKFFARRQRSPYFFLPKRCVRSNSSAENPLASPTFSNRTWKWYRSRAKRAKTFFTPKPRNFEVRGRVFHRKTPIFLPGGGQIPPKYILNRQSCWIINCVSEMVLLIEELGKAQRIKHVENVPEPLFTPFQWSWSNPCSEIDHAQSPGGPEPSGKCLLQIWPYSGHLEWRERTLEQ